MKIIDIEKYNFSKEQLLQFGFEEEGRLKNGVKIGDGYEDIVLMAKQIER